jgi:outer membrane protein assembly factor BamB
MIVAIDLRTGNRVLGPVEVRPNGFDPVWHRSRASLLLLNDVVYVGFGSRCEDPGEPIFHGWLVAFDSSTLQEIGAFQVTPPDVDGGGIWQASSGLASDGVSIYLTTGNRRPEADKRPLGISNFGDSMLRVLPRVERLAGGRPIRVDMQVADWFAPYRKLWLDAVDLDLGSSGPVLIPGSKFIMAGGKQGMMYVVDQMNMGKLDPTKAWTVYLTSEADDGPWTDGAVGRDGAVYLTSEADDGPWTDEVDGRPRPTA